MLPSFTFHVPTKAVFGKDVVKKSLDTELKALGATRVLLTYSLDEEVFKKMGLKDQILERLKAGGMHCEELPGIKPNPTIESVRKGIKIVREKKLDFIIAVGGGSTIDAAKAISLGTHADVDVWEIIREHTIKVVKDPTQKITPVKKYVPICTIVTLAATGSEMNVASVITNRKEGKKWCFWDGNVRPKISFLDPQWTMTVPPIHTKAGTFDVMSHAIDAYFSENSPFLLDNLLLTCMKTIKKYLPIVIKDPKNYEARSNIMWASTVSINEICAVGRENAGWYAHKMQHEVGAYFNNHIHGIGLSVITPGWMKKIVEKCPKYALPKLHQMGIQVFEMYDLGEKATVEGAKKVIAEFEKFLKDCGFPSRLSEDPKCKGVDEEVCRKMAKSFAEDFINHDNPLGFEDFTEEEVFQIYKSVL